MWERPSDIKKKIPVCIWGRFSFELPASLSGNFGKRCNSLKKENNYLKITNVTDLWYKQWVEC